MHAAQASNLSHVPPTWLPLALYSSFMEDLLRFKGYPVRPLCNPLPG